MEELNHLEPFENTRTSEQLETEIKQCFIDVFNETLKGDLDNLASYGAPYLGNDKTLYRFLNSAGIEPLNNIYNRDILGYLYKAWAKENKKRGLDFLKMYMQLLYPNSYTITQLWQHKNKSYNGRDLLDDDEVKNYPNDYWLTSRIRVLVEDFEETGVKLLQHQQIIANIVNARHVIELGLLRILSSAKNPNVVGLANGLLVQNYMEFDCYLKK